MGLMSAARVKSLDFYRKIPRDLTEATLPGAVISATAAVAMVLLFVMELSTYLSVHTSTAVVVDRSLDGDLLRINFNISFPALSVEFASLDVSDTLGTHRINLTKTVRKFPITSMLATVGGDVGDRPLPRVLHEDEELHEDIAVQGSAVLQLDHRNFDIILKKTAVVLVNFYAPWCPWSRKLEPVWENAGHLLLKKFPASDGRIRLAKVDCTEEAFLCTQHHIQGFPSVRVFRSGHDVKGSEQGDHEHESYHGARTSEAILAYAESLVPVPERRQALESTKQDDTKKELQQAVQPAPIAPGCRLEGFVLVKKVPGNLVVTAHSTYHSFEKESMNLSHVVHHLSFGRKLSDEHLHDVEHLMPEMRGKKLWADRLEDARFTSQETNVTHEHYLQVILTTVETRSGARHNAYEYTAHSHSYEATELPIAKFSYDPSPFQVVVTEERRKFSHFITNMCAIIGGVFTVVVTEERRKFSHFITNMCAIIGGVFTVAGIADSVVYNTVTLYKKLELGKQH
eukprot:jgi/Chlat1/6039/Chrsp4S06206